MKLPITDVLPQIVSTVTRGRPVVLKAPPGAGKTTGVPPALLESSAHADGQILLIQPRRLAARSAAARIAKLVDTKLGDQVGYHVRFDRKTSKQTKLTVMTTGILLRRLQSDPLMESVSCVILDEFHERSLELDLALGMLHRIRTAFRDDLRLIVMSATLDPQPIVDFLGNATGVISDGRSFPVEVRYAKQRTRDRVEDQVAACLPGMLRSTDGDVLVFLPGVGEIRRTENAIESIARQQGLDVLQLYGDLSPADQDRVVGSSPSRKIILSTNVAETSVTIPGVTAVIDSGLARVMTFDPKVGLPHLQLQPISQASAEQRAGRAGRTRPGMCHRLWPEAMHRARAERDMPEVLRSDLSAAVLTLASWGEMDVQSFPWLSSPSDASVQNAQTLLQRIDATDQDGKLTRIGERMLQLPVHPRVARLLVAAEQEQVVLEASIVAALLTERDPFRDQPTMDLFQRVETMLQCMNGQRLRGIQEPAARQVIRVAQQLQRYLDSSDSPGHPDTNDRIARALLTAFPDRVARRRQQGSDRGVMVGGRGVRFDRAMKNLNSELVLCVDVDSGDTEARVRQAISIETDWLPTTLLSTNDESDFHPTRRAIVTRRRDYFDDLLIGEVPVECQPTDATSSLLFKEAKRHWQHAFPHEDKTTNDFVTRSRFLSHHCPEIAVGLGEDVIDELLMEFCQTRTSLAQVKSAPWLDYLRGRFSYDQIQTMDREAPPRLTVPSGNSYAVEYEDIESPTMSVKLQEVFGWTDTPRLALGRVPLRLQLLGPNRRPQQITDDLASFWSTTYQQVRKDLRGRYPKHHWPENPLTAKATRNGMKPR